MLADSIFEIDRRCRQGKKGVTTVAFSEGITIVVADDDEALRTVTANCLRDAGMTVWEAADGEAALAMVREHRPLVLVLDLWMPGLDGLQVLDSLRFDPAAARLSVIILTGDGQADGRLLALAGGAACIMLKGGPFEALIETVRSCAEQACGTSFCSPQAVVATHDPKESGAVPTNHLSDPAHHPSRPDLP